MDFSCRGASPRLLVSLLLLSLSVLRIQARHGPEIAVADVQQPLSSLAGDAANHSHRQLDSQSPEVGAPGEWRQHDASASRSGGGGAASTTGAGSGAAESIAEWKRRSAEAGAHFFPLQRAEDAPSRDEIHRRILGSRGVGGGLRGRGETSRGSDPFTIGARSQFLLCDLPFLPPPLLPPAPSRTSLSSPHQRTASSKPFSKLSSTTLKYVSCADQRCQGGLESGYYGCSTEGFNNYLNLTGILPGDDALCVYDAITDIYDNYEADVESESLIGSAGHVVEDTTGHWGMQGWPYGSWSAGGVLGLGWYSSFLWQVTSINDPSAFALCLDKPTPTNKTGWNGQVPLQTGSSQLTIGATSLPAGASYATM
ncbi:unnamed protein product [Closterium sp. Naga37s-1]|nr:unnamed protein product [Closterium sp. Naga37s-1]